MPIYEYKCENGHVFDAIQKMTDEALTECEECGAPAARVLHPVAVHFKGSGFYNTDYGKKKGAGGGDGAKDSSGAGSGSDSGSSADSSSSSSSGDAKKSDSKKGDAKATTSS